MPRGVGAGNKKKEYNMFEIKIGKLSKTKIKEILFKELEDNGFHVTNVEVGNGYFLFDLGQNSVVHFNIKEIPYWKFGFWIQKDNEKKEYTIEFFGEKIDWIDKFKPSRCTISSSKDDDDKIYYRAPFNWTKNNRCHYQAPYMAVWHEMDTLQRLKKNRRIAEYGLSDTSRSFLKWLWDEIWFYDIEKPVTDFYEAHIQGLLYKAALWLVGLKYHKYVKTRPVIDQTQPGWMTSPRYETGVEYRPGLPEETVKKIWYKIEDSRLAKFMRGNSHFNQYSDSEARRGFYYPEYYEEKQKKEEAERAARLEKMKQKNNK